MTSTAWRSDAGRDPLHLLKPARDAGQPRTGPLHLADRLTIRKPGRPTTACASGQCPERAGGSPKCLRHPAEVVVEKRERTLISYSSSRCAKRSLRQSSETACLSRPLAGPEPRNGNPDTERRPGGTAREARCTLAPLKGEASYEGAGDDARTVAHPGSRTSCTGRLA